MRGKFYKHLFIGKTFLGKRLYSQKSKVWNPWTQGPPLIGALYPPEDNDGSLQVSGALLEIYQWVLASTSRIGGQK